MQGYGLATHQPLAHGFPSISQLTQVSYSLDRTVAACVCSVSSLWCLVFVLCRLTSLEDCQDLTTLQDTALPPSCCTMPPLSRAAAPTLSTALRPSRGRHSTSTLDQPKVREQCSVLCMQHTDCCF